MAKTGNQYLKTRVMTASPEELQLMLYDGLIRFCEQAREAVEQRDVEQSYNLLCRAQDIVMELMCSMKVDMAPDVCSNMQRLYLFCYERLTEANMAKDVGKLDEALRIIRHMRETWVMLMEKLKEQHRSEAALPQEAAAADESEQFAGQLGSVLSIEG